MHCHPQCPSTHKSLLSKCSHSVLSFVKGGGSQTLQLGSSQGAMLSSRSLLARPPDSCHACCGELPSAQACHPYAKVAVWMKGAPPTCPSPWHVLGTLAEGLLPGDSSLSLSIISSTVDCPPPTEERPKALFFLWSGPWLVLMVWVEGRKDRLADLRVLEGAALPAD